VAGQAKAFGIQHPSAPAPKGKQGAKPKSGEDAMREFRRRALTMKAATWGFKKDSAFPHVYGALMELKVNGVTITIVSLRDGATSLYTTGTFGVIGAGDHKEVRAATLKFLKIAERRWEFAKPTKDFSYPSKDQVRFFLLGYDGVRTLETTTHVFEAPLVRESILANAGSDVLTQIRLVSGVGKTGE